VVDLETVPVLARQRVSTTSVVWARDLLSVDLEVVVPLAQAPQEPPTREVAAVVAEMLSREYVPGGGLFDTAAGGGGGSGGFVDAIISSPSSTYGYAVGAAGGAGTAGGSGFVGGAGGSGIIIVEEYYQ